MQRHAAFYWIVYIICIDEALFCHVLTLFIFCFYAYPHFENQLGISANRLGQCMHQYQIQGRSQ